MLENTQVMLESRTDWQATLVKLAGKQDLLGCN